MVSPALTPSVLLSRVRIIICLLLTSMFPLFFYQSLQPLSRKMKEYRSWAKRLSWLEGFVTLTCRSVPSAQATRCTALPWRRTWRPRRPRVQRQPRLGRRPTSTRWRSRRPSGEGPPPKGKRGPRERRMRRGMRERGGGGGVWQRRANTGEREKTKCSLPWACPFVCPFNGKQILPSSRELVVPSLSNSPEEVKQTKKGKKAQSEKPRSSQAQEVVYCHSCTCASLEERL